MSVAPGHSSRARYQVFGTRISRCMSFATSAPPSRVSWLLTAQLLLPNATSASRSSHGMCSCRCATSGTGGISISGLPVRRRRRL